VRFSRSIFLDRGIQNIDFKELNQARDRNFRPQNIKNKQLTRKIFHNKDLDVPDCLITPP